MAYPGLVFQKSQKFDEKERLHYFFTLFSLSVNLVIVNFFDATVK